jgi:hypothetical protein
VKKIITAIILLPLFLCFMSSCANNPEPPTNVPESATELLLSDKDFFVRFEEINLTLKLDMTEKEFVKIIDGKKYEYEVEQNFKEEPICYFCPDMALLFDSKSKRLTKIQPGGYDGEPKWTTYSGINDESTLQDIINIFGEPSYQEISYTGDVMGIPSKYVSSEFMFVKGADGKYIRVYDSREIVKNEDAIKGFKCASGEEGRSIGLDVGNYSLFSKYDPYD